MSTEPQLLDVFIGIASAKTHNPGGFGAHVALCYLKSEAEVATLPPEKTAHSTLAGFAAKSVAEFLRTIAAGMGDDNNAVTTVYCNVGYVADAVNKWMPSWKRNGWMTKGGTPVKQRETWEEIEALLKTIHGSIVHLPGYAYSGDEAKIMGDTIDKAKTLLGVETDDAPAYAPAMPRAPIPPKPKEPEPVLAGQGLW